MSPSDDPFSRPAPFNPAATGGATDPLDTGTAIRTGAVVPPFRRDFDNARDPYTARNALGAMVTTGLFTSTAPGLVPASPGGKAKSLRADGTWLAGMTFLAELIASTSASLDDTTSITSAYDLYMIDLESVVPATNSDNLLLQVHSGGSFQTTTYLNVVAGGGYATGFAGPGMSVETNATTTNGVQCGPASGTNFSNLSNTGIGLSGFLFLRRPNDTTTKKQMNGAITWHSTAAGLLNAAVIGGVWNGGNGAIDGVRLKFNAGNITSGRMRIYGIGTA